MNNNTERLLDAVYGGMQEKKAQNIVRLDFRQMRNSLSDFFVICDAGSERQVNAIADAVEEFAFKQADEKIIHKEGFENLQWVLLDFTDVIVHIFKSEIRPFYNIEGLWADADIRRIGSEHKKTL